MEGKDNNRLAAVEAILAETAQQIRQSQVASEQRRAAFEQEMKESRAAAEQRSADFSKKLEQSGVDFSKKLEQSRIASDLEMQKTRDAQAETAKLIKQSQAETDRLIKALTEQVTGISKSNGIVAEDYFFNSFQKDKLNFFGEKFDKAIRGKGTIVNDEYDFVLINGKTAGIVEVKYKARKDDIPKALKKINTFRTNFPEYKNHKIYLAIAAFSMNITLENECKKQGIAVIKQDGDKVVVYDKNLKAF